MQKYAVCHKQCHDGLGGAWVAKTHDPNINIFFTSRKDEWKELLSPHLEGGSFVYFIDYAPSPADLEDLQRRSIDFKILDHHKTDFDRITAYDRLHGTSLMSFCFYDMKKAGCQVAWDYFFPGQTLPKMLEYIAVADLYTWRGPADHAVVQYIRTILEPDASIAHFSALLENFNEQEALSLGGVVYRRICKDVEFVAKKACLMDFDGTEVLAVNSAHYHSEIGHELSLSSPSGIGVIYTFSPANDGVKLSLRGPGSSLLAEKYQGGGHPLAAGCYMTIDQFQKYLKTARKNSKTEV